MAGCMVFVFAALGEFVVVKVLDVQYQFQITRVPKVIPMVSIAQHLIMWYIHKRIKCTIMHELVFIFAKRKEIVCVFF